MGRPVEFVLLVLLGVLLFGAKRLPDAARGLGESRHLFKKGLRGGDQPSGTATTPMRQVAGETEARPERERGTDPGV
jgi:sec-independent protein translocase protein TatA